MGAELFRAGLRFFLLSALGLGPIGCASSSSASPAPAGPEAPEVPEVPEVPEEGEREDAGADGAMAPAPATAEQIRGAWVVGLIVELRTQGPEGAQVERIRVVAADERGVEMEFSAGEAEGVAAPQRRSFTWEELAAHGLFPAQRTARERGRRETPLGPLEGWTYAISDDAGEVVTELFFADAMPGMPVLRRTREGDGGVVETAQVLRCVAGVDAPCP